MALGQRRTERQQEMWVATAKLPASIGHVFYDALNGVLRDQGQRTLTRLIDRAYAVFSFKVTPYEFAGAQCESSRLSLE